MISALVAVLVFGLVVSVVVIYARDPGPAPTDLAVGYELAWDRLDFETLFAMSGPEMRDGLEKADFVAAKRKAYEGRAELRNLVLHVEVESVADGDGYAVVRTRVSLRDGSVVHNDVTCARRNAAWVVSGYQLVPSPPQTV